MATSELEVAVRDDGGVPVIDLLGDVNSSAEATLMEAYAQAVAGGPRAVSLNFAGTEYINSTGIALIVGLLAQARTQDIEVRATGLSDHYREIFEITRLADFVALHANEASAVA